MNKLKLLICFLLVAKLLPGQDTNIYDINHIQEIKIYFEQDNWADILDSLKQDGNDIRVVGDVFVDGVKYEKAGIRYKGNSSYYNVRNAGKSKLPFNIKIDHIKDDQELPGGYTSLKLSNVFRDPSFLREVLSYEIGKKYLPSPTANFAKLYVNDEYLGFYNSSESVDDLFLDKYFGEHKGVLFKCDPNWHAKDIPSCPEGDKASLMYLGENPNCYMGLYELKTKKGWEELIKLTKVLNKNLEEIETVLDVDQILWMHAFNNVLINLDSYSGRLCHNYYLYQDTMGVFHPILWDMNLSFGGFRYTGLGTPLSNEDMQTLSPFVHYKQQNHKRPLITELMGVDLYRKTYVAHIKTILKENFQDSAFHKRALEIHKMIAPHVKEDSNKLYTYPAFEANLYKSARADKSNIIGVLELMEKRAEYLANHRLISEPAPVIAEVKHIEYDSTIAINATIEGAEKAWLYYRIGNQGNFSRIEMFDDSGHDDELENDNIWGATLEANPSIQYYVVAEGDKVAALSPERASMEFHVIQEN